MQAAALDVLREATGKHFAVIRKDAFTLNKQRRLQFNNGQPQSPVMPVRSRSHDGSYNRSIQPDCLRHRHIRERRGRASCERVSFAAPIADGTRLRLSLFAQYNLIGDSRGVAHDPTPYVCKGRHDQVRFWCT
jgi:hypothetical protein